jgi:DNA (cytosine-5)-methyltransferase 1
MRIETLSPLKWTEEPRLLSLFSGCGGMDLPFHKLGYKSVWAIDTNRHACDTYARNIAPVIVNDSIENINVDATPDADIIIGGFPCQDFSTTWKRPGLEGTRGNLYTYFLEFVNKKKPKVFVAENVKGLLSANNYQAIEQIIKDFEAIDPGYLVKPKLYNFADFGVPQLRERVLIVGVRMDTGFNFKHPAPICGDKGILRYYTAGEVFKGVEKVLYNNEPVPCRPSTVEKLKLIPARGNFADIPKDSPHYVKGMISHVYRRIHPDHPSATIIAAGGGGTWGYHYLEPRPLTNRERARLQSFPDDFIFEGSIAEVRRQIGNAVSPEGILDLVVDLTPLFEGFYDPVNLYALDTKLKAMSIKERLRLN